MTIRQSHGTTLARLILTARPRSSAGRSRPGRPGPVGACPRAAPTTRRRPRHRGGVDEARQPARRRRVPASAASAQAELPAGVLGDLGELPQLVVAGQRVDPPGGVGVRVERGLHVGGDRRVGERRVGRVELLAEPGDVLAGQRGAVLDGVLLVAVRREAGPVVGRPGPGLAGGAPVAGAGASAARRGSRRPPPRRRRAAPRPPRPRRRRRRPGRRARRGCRRGSGRPGRACGHPPGRPRSGRPRPRPAASPYPAA